MSTEGAGKQYPHTPSQATPDFLAESLQQWAQQGLTRRLATRGKLDFTSNDYLGLSRHPDIVRAAQDALHAWGVGGAGSRLLGGHLPVHAEVDDSNE